MSSYLPIDPMIIPYILLVVSVIIWTFIPFRQFRGNYFVFFLILAMLDPLMLFVVKLFHVHPFRFYSISSIFLIFSLLDFDLIKKRIPLITTIALGNTLIAIFANLQILKIDLLLQNIIIEYLILERTTLYIQGNNCINYFHLALNFYVVTLIIKDFVVLIDVKTGVYYFYITSSFEILIGLYFLFVNEKNSAIYMLESDGKMRNNTVN